MKIRVVKPVMIDRTYFPVGVQEVPDALAKHWYFKGLVADKHIILIPNVKAVVATKPPAPPKAPVKAEAPAKVEAPKKDA